jgi:hypothetical protein
LGRVVAELLEIWVFFNKRQSEYIIKFWSFLKTFHPSLFKFLF